MMRLPLKLQAKLFQIFSPKSCKWRQIFMKMYLSVYAFERGRGPRKALSKQDVSEPVNQPSH